MDLQGWLRVLQALYGRKGLGCLVDGKHDGPAFRASKAPALRVSAESWPSLESFVVEVINQTSTNSCVGHMYQQIYAIVEAIAGLPYDPPSADAIYSMLRATHGAEHEDEGTYIAAGKILERTGCASAKDWPHRPSKINTKPPAKLKTHGHERAGFQLQWLTGRTRLLGNINDALGHGYPVGFGIDVPVSYHSHRGSGVYEPRPNDPISGGHAQVIVAAKPGAYRILNSWGTRWGDGGLAWVDAGWITEHARSVFVGLGWERLRKQLELMS